MQNIKFRGVDKETGIWVYGYYIFTTRPEIVEVAQIARHGYREYCHAIHPTTLGQFTGLYDREKNEIYEGDIFWRSNHYGVVQFAKGSYYIKFNDGRTVNLWVDNKWNWKISEKEKHGNIHDNPQLIRLNR
jgi:hypothetical protein